MPQISRPLCALLAGSAVALAAMPAVAQPRPAAPASPVVVAPVTSDEVYTSQTFVGTVMPLKRATVGSAVDGRVLEFPVNEGDRVKKGDALAVLRTETIKAQIAAAEAELALREEELAELEAGSRPEEIEQARARMAAAKAQAEYAKAKSERIQTLFRQGRAVSKEETDEALSASQNARELQLEAEAAYKLAVEGPRKEKIAQAIARRDAQKANVEMLHDQHTKHTMIAPFDGYVVAEHTEVGQWVNRADLVAEVVALDQVDVQAYVLERHIPHIRIGQEVRVEIPAIPGQVFTGKVALIVPQADVRARTFPVKVRIENPHHDETGPLIKAGMLARALLPTGGKQQALLVPKDAIVLGGPVPMVYIADGVKGAGSQGKVRPVPVELGVAKNALIQVTGELGANDRVVVLGNERLRPGQDVVVTHELKPGEAIKPAAVKTASQQ